MGQSTDKPTSTHRLSNGFHLEFKEINKERETSVTLNHTHFGYIKAEGVQDFINDFESIIDKYLLYK